MSIISKCILKVLFFLPQGQPKHISGSVVGKHVTKSTIPFGLDDAITETSTTRYENNESEDTITKDNTGNKEEPNVDVHPDDRPRKPEVENEDETKKLENVPNAHNGLDIDLDNTENLIEEDIPKEEDVFDYVNYEYIEPDNSLIDNLIPNDRGASFANIVQATVVETSARSVRDPSIGSK